MLDVSDDLREVPGLDLRWTLDLQSPIGAVVVSPDGRFVAVALVEGSIFVLSTENPRKCGTAKAMFPGPCRWLGAPTAYISHRRDSTETLTFTICRAGNVRQRCRAVNAG